MALFPGALGDFVCFLPVLEKLAAIGSVDLFARTEYADLAPSDVRVHPLECHQIARLYGPLTEHEEETTEFFGSYSRTYSWVSGGQTNFKNHLRALSKGDVEFFPFLPHERKIHIVDYYLSCVGVEHPTKLGPSIPRALEAGAWCDRFWRFHGLERAPILALAPGSGAIEKNWPEWFFATVAEWWQRKLGGKVVVILGPVEEERARIDHLFKQAAVVRQPRLANLAALIRHCDLYIGNDSGPTHLAAALGVEVIALFGPTDPMRWGPRGEKVTILREEVECSPCDSSIMKACAHRKCLTGLDPENAIRKIETAWERVVKGRMAP